MANTSGEILDPNDALTYVLHTGSSNQLGNIIAINLTPEFNFIAGVMQTGVTYYVSAVAGNSNGMGGVVFSDACTDVAPGTPILFNPLPTISISGSTSICEGESAQATLSLSGMGPFTVVYQSNGVVQPPVTVPLVGSFPVDFTPAQTATVTLVSVQDGNFCSNTSKSEHHVHGGVAAGSGRIGG